MLYGGSYVTVIARSLGLVPDYDPQLSAPIASTTFGRQNILSMRVLRRFHGIGLRFRTRDHQIFVPVPLPAEGQIPVYLELQAGVPAQQPQQQQPQQQQPQQQQPQPDEDAPPPPPPPPQQPPQYPQHVLHDLPPAAQAIARDFDRRLRRFERFQEWAFQTLQEIRGAVGLAPAPPLPPSPPPEEAEG